ncbi:MAG: acyl-CoA thioesterase [Kiritimatiellales bacterium]
MTAIYETPMQVRDYECDIQGIVNNSVYQNYLEHGRHEFLHHVGLTFSALHDQGLDPVVTEITLQYKQSLLPRDRFTVRTAMRKEGRVRFVFDQEIIREDGALILKGAVTGVVTRNGRPGAPDVFDAVFTAAP